MEKIRYGYSYGHFKIEVCDILKRLCFHDLTALTALDVGAGEGIYWDLLHPYFKMDAVEIFRPYIEHNKLKEKYLNVFEEDIRNFIFKKTYDLIIIGDVLEHLSIEDAQKVIKNCQENCLFLMVAIPYELSQDMINGNRYEIHIQNDLTHDLFNSRYPNFQCLYRDKIYGYYLWRKE